MLACSVAATNKVQAGCCALADKQVGVRGFAVRGFAPRRWSQKEVLKREMLRGFVVLVALAALGGASGSANPCDEAMNACASACAGQGQEVMKNFCALTPLGLVKACVCASQTPSVALPEVRPHLLTLASAAR